jgi:dihydrodipicolinate synthase/N-acetylneuraminate lyase
MTRDPSVYCCAITPFDENLKLDVEAIRVLIGRLGAAGVGAFVGTSSPGEGFALSLDETETLYATAKEAMAGRAQTRAMGVEPHNADETWELIKIAQNVGLDAMQLYSLDLSHGNQPMMNELEAFFRTNLERMTIPAVISTHWLLGYLIPLEMLGRFLDDYPHLVGINCSTPDIGYTSRLIDLVDGRADVHVGGPQHAMTNFALGGQGFLCTEAILAPSLVGSVLKHWNAGNHQAMYDAFHGILNITAVNTWPGGSIRFTKAAMRVLGLPGWHMRAPYLPLEDSALGQIKAGFDRLKLAENEGLSPASA